MLYGSGKYSYEMVSPWAKLPEGWLFRDVGGLTVDAMDRVYVLNRAEHPVIVFDRDGNVVSHWGEGFFTRPHGSFIGPDGAVYCTDDGNHTVSKFTDEGKLLRGWGEKDRPSETGYVKKANLMESLATITHGGAPFNRPTGIALAKSGAMYITDGYGNARVHKFAADGTLLFSWGGPGSAPGQFMLPHNLRVDSKERIWVCDRENSRIQIFDAQGKFLSQWTDLIRPTDLFIENEEIVYVSELGPRVSIFTIDGRLITRWGNEPKDPQTDLFIAPHAITVDSHGDIYVGEVAMTHAGVDRGSRVVQKFVHRA